MKITIITSPDQKTKATLRVEKDQLENKSLTTKLIAVLYEMLLRKYSTVIKEEFYVKQSDDYR